MLLAHKTKVRQYYEVPHAYPSLTCFPNFLSNVAGKLFPVPSHLYSMYLIPQVPTWEFVAGLGMEKMVP